MNSLLRVLLISLIGGSQTLAQEINTQDAENVTVLPKLSVKGTAQVNSNNTVALNATSTAEINSNSTVELPVNSTAEVPTSDSNQVLIESKQSSVPEKPKKPRSQDSSVPEVPKSKPETKPKEPRSQDSSVPEKPKPEIETETIPKKSESKDSFVPDKPVVEEPQPSASESATDDVPTPSESVVDDVQTPSGSVIVDVPTPSTTPVTDDITTPTISTPVSLSKSSETPAPTCLTGCVKIPNWAPAYCDILDCPLPPQYPTCVIGSCPIPSFVPPCEAGPCVSPFVSFFPDVDVTAVISSGTSFEEQLLKLITQECTTLQTLPINQSRIKMIANFKQMMKSFHLLSSQVDVIQKMFVSSPYEQIVNVLVTPEYAGLCQTLGLTQSSLSSYSASSLQSAITGFRSSFQASSHAAIREYESYSSKFGIATSDLKKVMHSFNIVA